MMLTWVISLGLLTTAYAGCPHPNIENTGEYETDQQRAGDGQWPTLSAIFVTCLPGHDLLGADMLLCLETDEWEPNPDMISCKSLQIVEEQDTPTQCPIAPLPEWSSISGGTEEGDTVKYTCERHLRVVGNPEIRCVGGQWVGDAPVCGRKVTCKDPGLVAQSQRKINKFYDLEDFGPEDTIEYKCYHDDSNPTQPQRIVTLSCGENGEWDERLPSCGLIYLRKCPNPGHPVQGYRLKQTDEEDFLPKQTISFRCNRNYRFRNRQEVNHLTCGKDGLWDKELPICYDNSCDDPGPVTNSQRLPAATGLRFAIGTEVTYSCEAGYTVSSTQNWDVLKCMDSGEWNKQKPICKEFSCLRPSAPENGKILGCKCKEKFEVGKNLTFECNEGYRLEGRELLTCSQDHLDWDAEPPTCTAFEDDEGSVETLTTTLRPTPQQITRIPSKRTTTPRSNSTPSRVRISRGPPTACNDPGDFPNASRIPEVKQGSVQRYRIGDVITIQCNIGYTFEHPTDGRRVCLSDGRWEHIPQCIPTNAGKATPPTSPDVTGSERTTQPSVPGETPLPIGTTRTTRTFRPGRPDTTMSVERTTPVPNPTPLGGRTTTSTPTGTTRPYLSSRTTPRAKPELETTITRTPTREPGVRIVSTDKKNPTKIDKSDLKRDICNDPGEISNAIRTPELQQDRVQRYDVNDEITLQCKEGYYFERPFNGKMICLSRGIWKKIPRCVSISAGICPDPGPAVKATRTPAFRSELDKFAVGEKIEMTCNHGYSADIFYDVFAVTCLQNGTWEGELPVCTEIRCDRPGAPPHASVSPNRLTFRVGQHVTFKCDPGYELVGSDTLSCEHASRDWSGWLPSCRAFLCPDPSTPENGYRIGNDFGPGSTVKFDCYSGYTLTGSASRTCLQGRSWSGVTPTCNAGDSYCPPLPTPVGGLKNGRFSDVGDVVSFTCVTDFYLVGSARRECLRNGQWSGTDSHCEYIYSYSEPDKAKKEISEAVRTIAPPTIPAPGNCAGATSGAVDLYLVLDVSGSIKPEDLIYIKAFAKAVIDKVGVSKTGTHVAIILYDSTVSSHSKVTDPASVTPNAVKAQIDSIPRYGRGTATASALRYIRDSLLNSKTGRQNRINARNVMLLITDGKHNTGGNPVPVAAELKGAPYDMDMYTVAVGPNARKKTVSDIASSPEKSWYLQDSAAIKTVTDYLLSEWDTSYEEPGVGGPNEVPTTREGLKVKDIRQWPWVARIMKHVDPGRCFEDTLEFVCGATLIDRQWLLTARSCFEERRIVPGQLFVQIGSNFEKDYGVTLDVADVIFTDKASDDIGLVKLKTPLTFTPNIRPVLLPDPLLNDYSQTAKDNRWGWSVGLSTNTTGFPAKDDPGRVRGLWERGRPHAQIYQGMMYRLKHQSCQKRWNGFSQLRSFCALNWSGRPCVLDTGFPYMVQEYNRIVQIGILSSSTCCRSVFYTKVGPHVDWIKQTIEGHGRRVVEEGWERLNMPQS